jgi:molybdenum cofactor cytidylyltransferase
MATDKKKSMVAAVVLAGGASKRMGETNKLLAEVNGATIVRQAVETAINSEAAEVIVVTGYEGDLVREALSGFDVRFVDNPNYPEGLSTSLKAGIGAVSENHNGAVVLLGDMPMVKSATVNALIERFHSKDDKTICRPTFDGMPGNPILWPRDFFSDILGIQGDIGAKQLIERYSEQVSTVDVNDDGIHFDIDKPEDLNSV